MTRLQERQKEDETFIRNPVKWPMWPFLPIKRHVEGDKGPDCAFLCATSKPWERAYLENVFALKDMTPEQRKKIPFIEYDDLSALLADGWYVD